MKRKGIFLAMIVGLVLLVGCQNRNNQYEQSMHKAKEAIIEKKFDQAEDFVALAIESKEADTIAKNYQVQLKAYQEGLKLKKAKKLDEAKAKFTEVTKVKVGSEKLVEYAKKELADLTKETEKDSKNKKENKKKEETKLWTKEQSAKLADFMASWGQTMDQEYEAYNPQKNVDLYGIQLPQGVLDGQMGMGVDGEKVTIEWSEDGSGSADYQLVEVYSDADTQPYLKKHVYFFAFKNGEGRVYVTQQNQGNPENVLYFKETENQALKTGFANLLSQQEKGNSTATKESSTTKTSLRERLNGTYYNESTNEAVFSIDDSFYRDFQSEKDYPIDQVTINDQVTITWDIEKFEEKYGPRSAGPGPQPFIYKVKSTSDEIVLEDMMGQTLIKK
ncbi:DUF4767 domain-containing protein [Vagococcus carniphilus]|uniref:DUF4767 domain-containing protein n=1 Tax=Vagococcus carniphilus TaxID=218144 RepID=UPI003B59892C